MCVCVCDLRETVLACVLVCVGGKGGVWNICVKLCAGLCACSCSLNCLSRVKSGWVRGVGREKGGGKAGRTRLKMR